MLLAGHPDENVLEMYCMEKLDGPELEAVEDHLLVCAECQDRVTESDSFIRGMRAALADPAFQEDVLLENGKQDGSPKIDKTPWWRNIFHMGAMPVPVWATAAVAALGIAGVFFTNSLKPGAAPIAVVLTATRGGSTQAVKTAGPLDLDMDTRDLAPSGTYRVQVVNGDGAEVWAGSSDAKNGRIHALVQKRFSPGQYYVRIADPAGERREFALRLGN